MSRKEYDLTVNTGGEEGQILDHMLCARDPQVQRDDAKALLALVARLHSLAAFGAAVLALWWADGNPGDVDGAVLQDEAEKAGLWHRVERHADGVECEWCGGEGPCGELTEAGRAALGRKP